MRILEAVSPEGKALQSCLFYIFRNDFLLVNAEQLHWENG